MKDSMDEINMKGNKVKYKNVDSHQQKLTRNQLDTHPVKDMTVMTV